MAALANLISKVAEIPATGDILLMTTPGRREVVVITDACPPARFAYLQLYIGMKPVDTHGDAPPGTYPYRIDGKDVRLVDFDAERARFKEYISAELAGEETKAPSHWFEFQLEHLEEKAWSRNPTCGPYIGGGSTTVPPRRGSRNQRGTRQLLGMR
jgi:hypothetical protein